MSEPKLPSKRVSRGTRIVAVQGSPLLFPNHEHAHVTPRYPLGIGDSVLKRAAIDVQRETATFWFASNFRPYSEPPFAFDEKGAGWDEGRVDVKVRALQALTEEFGGILSDDLIHMLGEALGPDWMWIEESHASVAGPRSQEQLRADLLSTLEDLATQVRKLGPGHGQIGHNSRDDDVRITPEEQAEALDAISEAKSAVSEAGELDAARLEAAWSRFNAVAGNLGLWAWDKITRFSGWAINQADTLVSGMTREGGPALGKALPDLVMVGVAIWLDSAHASDLIGALLAARNK